MILRFMRLFRAFREVEAKLEAAYSERIQMETALREEVRSHEETREQLHSSILTAEQERTRRIAAETVASERRQEIDRMLEQNRELREELRALTGERLKSLDALNVRLMKESAPEPAPDMNQFRREQVNKVTHALVANAREVHRKADIAILQTLHPAFKKRISNVPLETEENVA